MTFPTPASTVRTRGDGTGTVDILFGLRNWDGGTRSPIGNIVQVQNPAHLVSLGLRGAFSMLYVRVDGVPNDIAWVTETGELNGVDSVLVWEGTSATRRYTVNIAGLRAHANSRWTLRIDRGLDDAQATPVNDIPKMLWSAFRPLLIDKDESLRNTVTDTELKATRVRVAAVR